MLLKQKAETKIGKIVLCYLTTTLKQTK